MMNFFPGRCKFKKSLGAFAEFSFIPTTDLNIVSFFSKLTYFWITLYNCTIFGHGLLYTDAKSLRSVCVFAMMWQRWTVWDFYWWNQNLFLVVAISRLLIVSTTNSMIACSEKQFFIESSKPNLLMLWAQIPCYGWILRVCVLSRRRHQRIEHNCQFRQFGPTVFTEKFLRQSCRMKYAGTLS